MLRLPLLPILFFVIDAPNCKAQTQTIQNLKLQISKAKSTSERLSNIFRLCEEKLSLSSDTLHAYAVVAKQLAEGENNKSKISKAEYFITYALLKDGLYDSIVKVCKRNIEQLDKSSSNKKLLADYSFLKAQALIRSQQYKEALTDYYQMLSKAETSGDTLMQIKTNTCIGWVQMEMNQNAEALKWFYKALQVSNNQAHYAKYSALYANMASTYNNVSKYDSARYFVEKALEGARQHEVLSYLANALNIRADVFMNTKNNAAAERDLNEALNIRKHIGDVFYVVSDISQLSFFYAENKLPQKGIAIAKQGIFLAEQYNVSAKLPILYNALAANYKEAGNHMEYAGALEKMLMIKDSTYKVNSAEALAELQAKYNLQRHENTIIQQKLELVSKNYLLFASFLLTVIALIVSYVFFKTYRRRQKMKMKRMMEEEKRIASDAVFKGQEDERKRIAADLHDNLGAYASAISANVDDLISDGNSNKVLYSMKKNASEIMMNLRDTIWVLNKEAIHITGISDRFKNYVQKISDSYSDISVEIKENIINDVCISPESGLSILRIMQEAFHNAIKHSRCKTVTIEIESNHSLHIRILDDGTGFELNEESASGNGLVNMKSRAKANGWHLSIQKRVPAGTLLELST